MTPSIMYLGDNLIQQDNCFPAAITLGNKKLDAWILLRQVA